MLDHLLSLTWQVTRTASLAVEFDGRPVGVGTQFDLPVGVYFLLYTATRGDQSIARTTSVTGRC
jgi:hypothetical protein